MGFDRNQLVESLRNRIQNEVHNYFNLLSERNCKFSLLFVTNNHCIDNNFRLQLLIICCWTTASVFLVVILELSFRRLWYSCFFILVLDFCLIKLFTCFFLTLLESPFHLPSRMHLAEDSHVEVKRKEKKVWEFFWLIFFIFLLLLFFFSHFPPKKLIKSCDVFLLYFWGGELSCFQLKIFFHLYSYFVSTVQSNIYCFSFII